ncbi:MULTISPECIES: RsmF rRNA methyltransferase first C-terminal domain-containing protein [unclassified Granulicatella]|uniref:RsmF rRNA methyltransferase first C-terminal domain-containing protein n=1 Tax=unclassified Granulicatella TaxID=2630493 RepID=UPI001073E1F2|nr:MULTISPECIES: RsmF rRNA methyltransferase first C-terminal domain-containing protein [unclassified Granulicatella]MBF0780270.1 RsmF rRNA methyltransferase first C-terminal domain-containing protein [Granulicatella sp. 19428wC4_WM01]TFU95606.1 NOL1/NOP2/sun family putative RNA methylase [Granulicatella sp. WM01]
MTLPSDFKQKYTSLLGEKEANAFFYHLEHEHIKKSFRLNPLKASIQLKDYINEDIEPVPYCEYGYYGQISGKSPLHQAGYIYSQEASAMLVATIANAQMHDKVLDLCAAPGGKSTHLAAQLNQTGLLVSNEIVPKRAKILAENIERCGITNCLVTNHSPSELTAHFPHFFDKIIVDAPCSGEGMFRKDDSAKQEWTSETPSFCAARQRDILTHALKMLKKGGELIYSTCTFAPEENEEIISWLIEQFPLTLLPISLPNLSVSHGKLEWGTVQHLDYTIRIWPHLNQGEGHFIARLRYEYDEENEKTFLTKNKHDKLIGLSKEQHTLFQQFTKQFPVSLLGHLTVFGDQLWLVPTLTPHLKGLKVLRAGLHLGTFLKNRFEPSFALAMALSRHAKQLPHISISYEQWKKYVSGETFSYPNTHISGWVLLIYQDLTIGFGKLVQDTVKNFYPKGLRFTP